jgi:hypothetical protein
VIAIRRLFQNRCQSHLARLTKQDATGLTEFASLERRAFDGITFRNTFFVVKGRESEALYFMNSFTSFSGKVWHRQLSTGVRTGPAPVRLRAEPVGKDGVHAAAAF